MKNIKKIFLFLLCFYLLLGVVWMGKIYVSHLLNLNGLPVLGYHSVVSDEDKQKYHANNTYVMSSSAFQQQMQYLYDHQYKTLTMEQINDYYQGGVLEGNCVALTFDDGFENFNTIVKPILQKYNFHATAFVIGKKTIIEDNNDPSKLDYLKQQDLVNDEYVSYYSHSYNLHRKSTIPYRKLMETASLETIEEDFIKNKELVSDTYFAFPYGVSSKNANIALQKNNVTLAFGYNQNRNMDTSDNRYLLPRYLMFDKMPMWYFSWITERK